MILKPHHTNFAVSDLDRSIVFYRDALGFKLAQDIVRENLPSYDVIFGRPNIKLRVALFQMPNAEMFLELFQFYNPAPVRREQGYVYVGSSHVAYQVDDLDAEHQRITALGYRFINPPADVYRDGKYIAKGAYLLDPDGIILELFESDPVKGNMVMPDKVPVARP